MDEFYKNPDVVVTFIDRQNSPLHKTKNKKVKTKYNNGRLFKDKRLDKDIPVLEDVYNSIRKHLHEDHDIRCTTETCESALVTNETIFIDKEFNDYEKCYWHPHKDENHINCIVYLNKNSTCGTNLYRIKEEYEEEYESTDINAFENDEHRKPWTPKTQWEVLFTIEPKYNRLVIFDGDIYHGMNVTCDKHFSERRLNQVIFFVKGNNSPAASPLQHLLKN